jgi:hypothetical protein
MKYVPVYFNIAPEVKGRNEEERVIFLHHEIACEVLV